MKRYPEQEKFRRESRGDTLRFTLCYADVRPIVLTAANEDDVRVVAELIEVVQYPDHSGP